jgi:transposase
MAGSRAAHDPSWRGSTDGTGLRADQRSTGKVPARQADRQSYLGIIPSEDSSGGRQRLGHISKQGNAPLRFLLVEAAQAATRCNQQWRQRYWHLAMRREKSIAEVALGRRMAVRLYWMWRNGWDYAQLVEFGSHAGQLATGHGVN